MLKNLGKDTSCEQRKTNRLHHKVNVCVSQMLFHPQAQGLLGLVATILSSTPIATQSLSLGVTSHRLASQLLLCLCAGSSLSSQPDIPFFQDMNLSTSNAYSCKIQIRHTRNVLNIWMDVHGPLPELQLFRAKYLRIDCVQVLVVVSRSGTEQTGLALFRDAEKLSWCLMHFQILRLTMKRRGKDSP